MLRSNGLLLCLLFLGLIFGSQVASAQTLSSPRPRVSPTPRSTSPPNKPVRIRPTPKASSDQSRSNPYFSIPSFVGYPESTLSPIRIDLNRLPLLPDPQLAKVMDAEFNKQVAALNTRIAEKQTRLQEMLLDWSSNNDTIRAIQVELSETRTERDRLALEHLLIIRQLQDRFVLPIPARSPSTRSSPAGTTVELLPGLSR